MVIDGWWDVRLTRYPNLGYIKLDTVTWRFVCLQDWNEGRREQYKYQLPLVGQSYRTRYELLADLERYAKEWGY